MKTQRTGYLHELNPNRGFTQEVSFWDSLQQGRFNRINLLPLEAFGALATAQKNKRYVKRFG